VRKLRWVWEPHTNTVARFGLTVFIFPSLPTMASHICSHGGVASSSITTNSGLSHLVISLGSSYLKTRFSKSSSSYPPSVSLSARSFLLISRHRSAGVPTRNSKTISLQYCRWYTDYAAWSLQCLGLAVQLIPETLDVIQPIGDDDVIARQYPLHG
jgi:hypothetical protein